MTNPRALAETKNDKPETKERSLATFFSALVAKERQKEQKSNDEKMLNAVISNAVSNSKIREAILAGGCFWGMETYFKKLPGVLKTEVGYTGGSKERPTYKEVCSEKTGHYEAVRVTYDSSQLTYAQVLLYFFEIHDFTQKDGQGVDIGKRYMSRIFYHNSQEKEIAEQLIAALLEKKGMRAATELLSVSQFWRAEEYHQNFHEKNHVADEEVCHVRRKLL